jgi:hypothetical protein
MKKRRKFIQTYTVNLKRESSGLPGVDKYLKMTGQTMQELMGGEFSYGMTFIIEELVPKCLKEKKKIVWKDLSCPDEMSYKLKRV